jgi:nonsense-mediated mRNA decay protein 3
VGYCNQCARYLQPPRHWIRADLESKELLTFCIKRVKGLGKVKLVDAGFIWTEPHSKRLKIKLTIQKEVLNGAILQQTFVVEYVVEWRMCDACSRAAANADQWTACVQVRQKVEHKRTFLFLEQLILKHGMEANTIGIKSQPDGLDFYYGSRSHGLKLLDFLQQVVPVRARHDKQLVSHNANNNTYNYQYTFMVEIVPVCKEDIVCLPYKVSLGMGGVGPIMLVTRVGASFQLTDVATLRQIWVDAPQYYRSPYRSVGSAKMMTEYIVLDIEPVDMGKQRAGKYLLADVQVARVSDFGVNDVILHAKTHLGHHLHAGDTAFGYDLASLQIVDPELEKYKHGIQLPDVLLVKKSYQEKRRKRRQRGVDRAWKLQRMDIAEEEGAGGARGAREEDRRANDEEAFLQELEEDEDVRAQVQIFKAAPGTTNQGTGVQQHQDDDESDDDVPEVPIECLLDELSLNRQAQVTAGDEYEEEEGEYEEGESDDGMAD